MVANAAELRLLREHGSGCAADSGAGAGATAGHRARNRGGADEADSGVRTGALYRQDRADPAAQWFASAAADGVGTGREFAAAPVTGKKSKSDVRILPPAAVLSQACRW